MDKQKAPWKLGSKQIPLYYLVTQAKSVCFRFSRSYSLSPFLNNLKFLLVCTKWKLKCYKKWTKKAPWKSGSKQMPLHYLVTLAMRVCFDFLRSYSLSPFLNCLKFLLVSAKIITIKMCSSQNQLNILISIISTIFVITRPVYWNKWK